MANYNSSHTGVEIDSAVGRVKSTAVSEGTVAASSAVVVDSNKDISGFRNIVATGSVTADSFTATGNTTIGDAATDTIAINSTITTDLIFEGSSADANELTLTPGNPSADRTITLPDATDTLVGKATSDVLTNKTLTSPDINSPDLDGGTVDAITSLTVANNVDIGSFDLRAATLTADGLTSGRVVFAGTNGVLSDDSDLSFSGSTLSATNITSSGTVSFGTLTDSGESIAITKFVDEGDAIASNDNDTTIPTSAAIKDYVDTQDAAIASDTLTFTNKTFDVEASGNSISNIDVADLKSGVLDTDISSVSSSDDTIASAKAIKTYVDSQVTAQDLDFQGDSGGALSIDLDSETLDIAGGTGIDTSGSSNTLTVAIDSTVATLTGSQTLTNKTLTSPDINGGTADALTSLTVANNVDIGNHTLTANGLTIDGTFTDGTLSIASGSITSAVNGTFSGTVQAEQLTTTDDATIADQLSVDGTMTISTGSITDSSGSIDFGNENLSTSGTLGAGAGTFTSLSVTDGNITNIGDIALDSISADGSTINVAIGDNTSDVFTIKQGSDKYFAIATSNSAENIAIGTGVSGTAISIGHSTSVTTVNDNLIVTGDLTVNGATSTISTTNTVVSDTLIELGNGTSGTPANDSGIVIERGSADNAFLGFDESDDKFIVGTGSFTGASTGSLTITTGTLKANVEGNLDVSSSTLTTSSAQNLAIMQGAGANVDIGAFEMRAQTFESDVSTGTAPMVIASTTKVANLNADLLDDQTGSYYLDFGNFVIDNDEIPIAKLAEDSITIAGSSTALGGSITADTIAGQISADTISGNQINGGTIGSVTISQLAGALDANSQAITNVNIDSGNIDGATIATSDITVGSGKTLNVSAGTLTLADNQISGDKVEGGTIASITISSVDINGGTIDGVAGAFTTLTASDDVNFDSNTLFVDASENRVGIGTNSPDTILDINSGSSAESSADAGAITVTGQNSGVYTALRLRHEDASGGGTDADEGIAIKFQGYDGSNFRNMAQISVIANDAVGSSDSDGNIVFSTTTSGGTALSEKMRITESGKVSMFSGGSDASTSANVYADNLVIRGSNDGNGSGITIFSEDDEFGTLYFGDGGSGADAYRGYVQYSHSANELQLGSDGSTRLIINNTGTVSIGSIANEGDAIITNGADGGRYDVLTVQENGNERWNLSFEGNGSTNSLTLNSNASSNIMHFAANGNVGIGTSSPGANLDVHGGQVHIGHDGASDIYMSPDDTDQVIRFSKSAGGNLDILSNGGVIHLNLNGNVGVGTGSPNALLHCRASGTGSLAHLKIDGDSGSGDGGSQLSLHYNDNQKWKLLTRNQTSVGNAFSLQILDKDSNNGVFINQDDTSFTSNSDERMKENLVELENATDKLNTLRCVSYNMKHDESNQKRIGLIAQDVYKIYPEATNGSPDNEYSYSVYNEGSNHTNAMGLKYTELIAPMIKAIQELSAKVEELEKKCENCC